MENHDEIHDTINANPKFTWINAPDHVSFGLLLWAPEAQKMGTKADF